MHIFSNFILNALVTRNYQDLPWFGREKVKVELKKKSTKSTFSFIAEFE